MTTAADAPPQHRLPQRRAPRSHRPPPALARFVLIGALLAAWHAAVVTGVVDRVTVPTPIDCAARLLDVVGSGQFWADAWRSAQTTVAAFIAAASIGLLVGAQLARRPLLGRILEPYLVGAYAVPVIVFYPTLLVVMGLGAGPIIVTAFLSAVVPVLLTTTVAFGEQSSVHRKLARSLGCTPFQALRKITLPGTLPLLLPGLKLAFIFSMASTIGVEFIVASAGLGFRVGELYRGFETIDMYVHIVCIFVLATLINQLFNVLERAVRRDLA